MSATDVHEGFWPNVAAPGSRPAALERGDQPIAALEAPAQPIALAAPAQPHALEAAPTIAAIEAASPNVDDAPGPDVDTIAPDLTEPASSETAATEPAPTEPAPAEIGLSEPEAETSDPIEAAVIAAEAAATPDETSSADPGTEDPATEVAAEVNTEEPVPIALGATTEPIELSHATDTPATDIAELAAELDADQRTAMEDVIDLGDFGTDPIDTGIEADQLDHLPHLPIADRTMLGGGNLDAARAGQPRTLAAHRELESAVMAGTETLTEFDRTLIGLIVAIENRSGYWQVHLRRRLERWRSSNEVDALASDWTRTDLAVRERAMLAFAVKLTLVPGQMTEQDAQLLANVGFNERDLLDIVDVVAYWGFATRVAEGLGVFVEPWLVPGNETA